MNTPEQRRCTRPRVVRVDLSEFAATAATPAAEPVLVARARCDPREWKSATPQVDRVGAWSGSALATALVYESVEARGGPSAPLVLAVGECVRRAVATAARTTVASVAPASGLYAEGQVGSDVGRRLARACDALAVSGRTDVRGAVLALDSEGDRLYAELWSFPAIVGLDPVRAARAITARLGDCATLSIGRAGERQLPFANLAAGAEPPSFVGRGGLGAVLGRLGLKALAVRCAPVVEEGGEEARGLTTLLTRSPRLLERAAGGSFELFDAFAARGDLRARNYEGALAPGEAHAWSERAAERDVGRKGCRGCPTPCGWVFEGVATEPETTRRGGRFSAFYALGPNLGLADLDAARTLLAACDDAGVDAKEIGAVLSLACTAQAAGRLAELGLRAGELWGNTTALRDLIDATVDGRGVGARLARGARAFAADLGFENAVFECKGQAVRPESNLAALLGQCVSSRGADPMRANPFSIGQVDRSRLAKLVAPLDLPHGAEDPLDPAGKGRIVWWHENWMAAVDMSGFCAFSASGLIADGVCDMDDLARWIAPEALRAECASGDPSAARSMGDRLLAAGASIVALQRRLNHRLGARADDDRPAFARQALDASGMWPEYAALRGLDESGNAAPDVWNRVGEHAILDTRAPFVAPTGERPEPIAKGIPPAPARGVVRVRASGLLERALGKDARFELDLPAPLESALRAIERERPSASGMLLRGSGDIVPAVYRAARRLDARDLVCSGDELHLVVALSGG